MRVCIANFDNYLVVTETAKNKGTEIIQLSPDERKIDVLVENLIKNNVEVFIQIAPQWQWGRYVEEISMKIMDSGIKLLCGEGALFRWFGPKEKCGRDIGFYLAPWGYSGNSKTFQTLPTPTETDRTITRRLRKSFKPWDKNGNNGKVLILGQLAADKSKYFSRQIKDDNELIEKCIKVYGPDCLVYRPHPKDSSLLKHKVKRESSNEDLYKIVHNYYACCSINSTGSIEAMCAGVPTINDGCAMWHGARPLIQPLTSKIIEYDFAAYENVLAAIVHLHYLQPFKYGNPLSNALNFYSEYNAHAFAYNCILQPHEPTEWPGYEVI